MMLETFRRLRTFCIFDLIQIIFNYNGLNRIGIYVMICPKENLVKSKYSYENFKFKKKIVKSPYVFVKVLLTLEDHFTEFAL